MQVTINQEAYEIADDPSAMLLWVLRDELGLVGGAIGQARMGCMQSHLACPNPVRLQGS